MTFFTYTAKNQEVILEAVRFRAHEGTVVRAHLAKGSALSAEIAAAKYLIAGDEHAATLRVSHWMRADDDHGLNYERVFRSAKAAQEFVKSQQQRYGF